jgi:hypothetical protein
MGHARRQHEGEPQSTPAVQRPPTASPTTARTPPPLSHATLARLQAGAGNRATGRLLARESDPEVAGEEYAKEAESTAGGIKSRVTRWWGDLHVFESDKERAERLAKKAAGPEKASEIMDDSLKLAAYVDDALKASEATLEWTADAARYGDGRKQLSELAGKFGGAAKQLKRATSTVDWINNKIKIFEDASELYEAVKLVNEAKTSEQAAAGFDALFGIAGKLGKRLPEGPWSAYFEFLEGFTGQGGFFSNMIAKFKPENRVSGYDEETMRLFKTDTVYEEMQKGN